MYVYLSDCVATYGADSVHVPADRFEELAAGAPPELRLLLVAWDGPCVEFRAGGVVVGRANIGGG